MYIHGGRIDATCCCFGLVAFCLPSIVDKTAMLGRSQSCCKQNGGELTDWRAHALSKSAQVTDKECLTKTKSGSFEPLAN